MDHWWPIIEDQMTVLKELLGDSYQTKIWGIILIILGALCLTLGRVFTIAELSASAIAMIMAGVGFMLTRSEAASVAAHQESLTKIAQAEREGEHAHNQNVIEIDRIKGDVAEVKVEAAQVAEVTAKQVIENKLGRS